MPAPTFRFLQLPDGLTQSEEESLIALTKSLSAEHGYQKACQIAEAEAVKYLAARLSARKTPALNDIFDALPIGITHFSMDSEGGYVAFALSAAIHEGEIKKLKDRISPDEIEISRNRRSLTLTWNWTEK